MCEYARLPVGSFTSNSGSSGRKSRTQEKLWVRLLSAFDRKKSDPNFYASEFFQDRSGSVRLLSSPQRIAATPTDTSTEKTRTKKSRTDLPKSYIRGFAESFGFELKFGVFSLDSATNSREASSNATNLATKRKSFAVRGEFLERNSGKPPKESRRESRKSRAWGGRR